MKVIEKNFSDRLISAPYVKKQNIEGKSAGRAGGIPTPELAGAAKRLMHDQSNIEIKLSHKEKVTLDLMANWAVRDLEINALKWKHFDAKTGSLDLTTLGAGKSQGQSRFTYLDKTIVEALNQFKGKPEELIFGKKGVN